MWELPEQPWPWGRREGSTHGIDSGTRHDAIEIHGQRHGIRQAEQILTTEVGPGLIDTQGQEREEIGSHIGERSWLVQSDWLIQFHAGGGLYSEIPGNRQSRWPARLRLPVPDQRP